MHYLENSRTRWAFDKNVIAYYYKVWGVSTTPTVNYTSPKIYGSVMCRHIPAEKMTILTSSRRGHALFQMCETDVKWICTSPKP